MTRNYYKTQLHAVEVGAREIPAKVPLLSFKGSYN